MASYDDTATVSGVVAVVPNGADEVSCKSVKVTLPASLDGYSGVEVVNEGKNLIPFAQDYPNFTQTKNGMTISVLDNGKVKFNGTTTANTDFSFYLASSSSEPHLFVKNGTYTFSNIGSASVKMVVSGGGNNGFPYREITNGSYTGTVTDETKPFNYIIFRISSGVTLSDVVIEPMLERGSTASAYEPYITPDTYTASLESTIYGGEVDVVNGTGTDENGNDFTFTGQEVPTRLGYNAFWSEQGNTEVTYYKDGYGFTSVTVHKETPDGEPVEETRKLHRIIYEGQVNVISGTGLIYRGESGTQYDPPETLTFPPITMKTDEGENTLYADEGASVITYRKEIT